MKEKRSFGFGGIPGLKIETWGTQLLFSSPPALPTGRQI
jgi:hypothetical protein